MEVKEMARLYVKHNKRYYPVASTPMSAKSAIKAHKKRR